ncbi:MULTISPECIES: hypothetical protein [Enterobacter]|uniref:hypothetical protein n=1 Tax=Enterobacter TaxID=547 RepID=UPI001058B2A4|nr:MULTISPECIES: hypothetical protein [Enterobacter]MCK7257494.1 hypothetical protein [Enterobacter asburiae]QBN09759.1 hypothetical protein E2E36_07135 [Enterobacter cloacae complex sp.]MEB5978090.1 hypothetical protein [Enterobacter vonholyi]MEB7622753.1 hypothetical protein [Enterobacter vonholyi]THC30858.1 hypothetical protein E3V94_00395 [Enterobacter sp. AD2-3]
MKIIDSQNQLVICMECAPKIDLNVCKSWSCPNLGIPDASDYVVPVYRLGYAALECQKCGSLPPLFNKKECDEWFRHFMQQKLGNTGQGCPRCFTTRIIHYGYTKARTPRLQCCTCRYVFTPHYDNAQCQDKNITLLSRLEQGVHSGETTNQRVLAQAVNGFEHDLHVSFPALTRVSTTTMVLPFQGHSARQKLYVVISADADSGKIIQITTNYCDWKAGDSLLYKSSQPNPSAILPSSDVDLIREQEKQFLTRSQFDEIQYGSAELKRNDRGSIVRPVITIHSHFQRLKRRFPGVTDHYLAHECVLRGGAITAWSTEVRRGKTNLWFVSEKPENAMLSEKSFYLTGSWKMGWWKNVWERWDNGKRCKMIGLLTGQQSTAEPALITLAPCTAFGAWLKAHPWSLQCHNYGARVVSQHLVGLGCIYNQKLIL